MTKRPSKHDRDVLAEVAKKLIDDVMGWVGDDKADRDGSLADLTEVIQDAIELDGYELAKCLEDDFYWNVDSRLVEILDRAEHLALLVVREKAKQWVKDNEIKPLYSVGDHVRWASRSGEKRGKIAYVWGDNADYTIQEDGREYPVSKIPTGWIVEFEKVLGLCEAVEAK